MYDSRFFYENLKVPTVAMGKHTVGGRALGGCMEVELQRG